VRNIIILTDYPRQGQFIVSQLAKIGKNQAWLSKQLNMFPSQLSAIIHGKHRPSLVTARNIARVLDVSLDDFADTFD